MRLRIIILVVVCLSAVGTVWAGIVVWDSYAAPSDHGGWVGSSYHASGNIDGKWEEESGPINFNYVGDGHTDLVYPLEGRFLEAARRNDPLRLNPLYLGEYRKEIRDGWFSGVRVYLAEDEGSWVDSAAKVEADPSLHLHVYATRYGAYPLNWIPETLFAVFVIGTWRLSRSLGRLRIGFAMLSLLTTAFLATIWVRSYTQRYPHDAVGYLQTTNGHDRTINGFGAIRGSIFVGQERQGGMDRVETGFVAGYDAMIPHYDFPGGIFRFGGERYADHLTDGYFKGSFIVCPIWLPLLALLWLPFVEIRRMTWKLLRKPFACKTCGYDLRATPERCPECGTVAKVVKLA